MLGTDHIAYIAGIFDGEGSLHIKRSPEKKKTHKGNPKKLKWISKPWDQIQESIVNTHNHFISCLNKKRVHDTSGADNIKSLSLVFASYQSNKHRKEIQLNEK